MSICATHVIQYAVNASSVYKHIMPKMEHNNVLFLLRGCLYLRLVPFERTDDSSSNVELERIWEASVFV